MPYVLFPCTTTDPTDVGSLIRVLGPLPPTA